MNIYELVQYILSLQTAVVSVSLLRGFLQVSTSILSHRLRRGAPSGSSVVPIRQRSSEGALPRLRGSPKTRGASRQIRRARRQIQRVRLRIPRAHPRRARTICGHARLYHEE